MDEVERDIESYQGRGWRYNANRGLDNSRHHAKTEFNSYYIIRIRFIRTSYKFNYFKKILELLYFISKNASVVTCVSILFVDVTSELQNTKNYLGEVPDFVDGFLYQRFIIDCLYDVFQNSVVVGIAKLAFHCLSSQSQGKYSLIFLGRVQGNSVNIFNAGCNVGGLPTNMWSGFIGKLTVYGQDTPTYLFPSPHATL